MTNLTLDPVLFEPALGDVGLVFIWMVGVASQHPDVVRDLSLESGFL